MHSCHSLCSERDIGAAQSRLGKGCVTSERCIRLRRLALQPIAAIARSKSSQRSSTAVLLKEESTQVSTVCVFCIIRRRLLAHYEHVRVQERHSTSHAVCQDSRVNPPSLFPASHVKQLYPLLVLYFPFGALTAYDMYARSVGTPRRVPLTQFCTVHQVWQ